MNNCLDDCGCMSTDICGFEFVDLRFGVSCPYGQVRCCKYLQVGSETSFDAKSHVDFQEIIHMYYFRPNLLLPQIKNLPAVRTQLKMELRAKNKMRRGRMTEVMRRRVWRTTRI